MFCSESTGITREVPPHIGSSPFCLTDQRRLRKAYGSALDLLDATDLNVLAGLLFVFSAATSR